MKSKYLAWGGSILLAAGLGVVIFWKFGMAEHPVESVSATKTHALPSDNSAGEFGAVQAGADQRAVRPVTNSNSSLEKFLDLKERANRGDPAAQRDLSEAYGRCVAVSGDPQKFLGTYEAIAKQATSQSNAKGMMNVARAYVEECAVVDGGAIVPLDARNLWLEQAARGGDLAAQARLQMSTLKPLHGEDLRGFVDKVAVAGDPAAVFELGQLLAGNSDISSLGEYGSVAAGPVSGYAWSIAACQMGLNCDAGSDLMNSICMNTGGCSSASFESYVRSNLLGVGDAALLDSKVKEVKSILSKN
ncbi:sel1 repeat family protein [Xanthomonas sp. D-99]|uniref:sel1 repeat family protein n=1 Tax=Xanthomonas sp. D-99 TaxID=2821273 RepID=UPI001ADCF05B|nr:sel1 repeat family protein [Xanthomonas sp. D-99]MBO9878400.1 sel1 repeat family protein [Xanthomonas sp. D-99]